MRTSQIEERVLDEWAERRLIAKGATVTWPNEDKGVFVTPIAFYRNWKGALPPLSVFYQRLRRASCPKCPRRESPTGRLLEFAPTPATIAFLMAEPHPRRAL